MFTLSNAFFSKVSLSKVLLSILLMGVAGTTAAHTYFFGVTELNLNITSKHIEVVHQLTAHDIDNAIAEIQQVHFSAEHPQYDKFIQDYIEGHFILARNDKIIKMNWIGFEVKRGQLFAYQESASKNYLTNLVVKNSILVDTYVKQVNTVNYQSLSPTNAVQGSLTFDQSLRVAIITSGE
tara:strand:- start:2403 stop:2942 length:540 start_codon:yes stop_codon:yes gene_type:complete